MFFCNTYFCFEYFLNILSFLSEYTHYFINQTDKMSIEFATDKVCEEVVEYKIGMEVAENKPRIEISENMKTHKEICDLYTMECKQKSIEFIDYEDFIEKFISYSQTFGVTKVTKIKKKYLEDSFYSLKFDLNKGIEKIHLQSL